MSSLLFFITVLLILVLTCTIIAKSLGRRNVTRHAKILGIVIGGYALLWIVFFFAAKEDQVSFGKEICFDDWCATVLGADTASILGTGAQPARAVGRFIILSVRMSNHARGIAQKPSEPRVHIIDQQGHIWPPSIAGQVALARMNGKMPDIGDRLELNEALETKIVFDIPKHEQKLKALIEEGPFITRLLLPEDKAVFLLGDN